MHSYLVTTTTDNNVPRLVVIGHLDSYIDHLSKHERLTYFPGYAHRTKSGMRVAKQANIAIVNVNTRYMYNVVKMLATSPFTTFDANLEHIDLQSQYPELFL